MEALERLSQAEETQAKKALVENIEVENQTKQADDPDKGKLIDGRYEVIRKIGRGSQGHVYLARSIDRQEIVAIKMLRIDSVKNWKEYDLFERESQVLSGLNIEGVARFIESFECLDEQPPCAYIVQEFVDGVTLSELLDGSQRLSKKRVFNIACQLSVILEKLHKHEPQIIHRDLKPGNVMIRKGLDDSDQVFLIDFGAVANPQIQSGGSTVAGTFGYMPPEQLVGSPSPASDIYALGAMVVYMLSGVSPADMQTSSDYRLVIEPHLEGEPSSVVSLLQQMLDPNAATRITNYGLLQRAFSVFSEGRYDIDVGSGCMDYSSSKFSNQLEQVSTLWQPGNFSLWQALPDALPRPLTPAIAKFQPAVLDSTTPITNLWDVIRFQFNSQSFRIVLIILLIVALVFTFGNNNYPWLVWGIWAIIIATILINIVSAFMWLKNEKKNVNAACVKVLKKAKHNPKDVSCAAEIQQLVSMGKKGIATVTKVKFLPNDASREETYRIVEKEACYVHDAPRFEVRYKFTPAGSDKVMFGRIVTHRCPVGKLMSGDTLPILYLDNKSMPFPFVLSDVTKASDLVSDISDVELTS